MPLPSLKVNDRREAPDFGDFPAFYREFQGLVRSAIYRIAGPDSLDDLVQETFLKAWKGLDKFRGDSSLKTWVYRIATHVALDYGRSRMRQKSNTPFEDHHGAKTTDPVSDRNIVMRGLGQLTPAHRAAVVLHLIEGLSIDETAEALDIPSGTVKSQIHYAKKALEDFLTREGVTL